MAHQLNHKKKKVVTTPSSSCPRVLRKKNGNDTRQEHQTPPPNHRREIQAGAFHSPETIHASKLELPRTRVALRRTHHQSPPTGKSLTQAIFPNILAARIGASKKIQSSTIHPTSNRDVRRETVDRVTSGSVNQR
ncbi:hypothetical protein Bca52824_056819 [Brassica carinata]|uniref:Uncharacterized protein n=1 Tax=Brassica carinata TaxID=52824 RepID=A0A8X7QPG0_BRACI|nr:hypothetical protein Bca52824_056819 [Brassica carinata]